MAAESTIAKFGIEVEGAAKLSKADADADAFESTLKELAAAVRELSSVAKTLKGSDISGEIKEAGDAAEQAEAKTSKWGKALGAIGAAVAAHAGIGLIKDTVNEVVDLGNEISTQAARVGVSTDEWQRWSAVAKIVGATTEDLGGAMKGIAKNAQEAQKAGSEQSKIFDRLGVSTTDASGKIKPAGALLKETGLALGALSDEGEATSLSMKLMEDAGLKLLPAFKKGEKELDRLLGTVDEFGMMSPDMIAKMQEAREAQVKWDLAIADAKTTLVSQLLPGMVKGMTTVGKWIKSITSSESNMHLLKSAVITAGGALVVWGAATSAAWAPFALKIVLITALFALAALAVDDFIGTFQGRDTVIRSLFETANGEMTSFGLAAHQAMNEVDGFIGKIQEIWAVRPGTDASDSEIAKYWDAIKAIPGKAIAGWGLVFTEDLPGAFKAVDDAFAAAATAIEGQVEKWVAAGKSLITGLAKGIAEGAPAVATAAVTAVGDALGLTKVVNQVQSPSKKWGAELGKPLMQGTAGGIDDGRKGVIEASQGAIAAAAVAGRGAIGDGMGGRGVEIRNSWTVYANGAAGQGLGAEIRGALGPSSADADRRVMQALELG